MSESQTWVWKGVDRTGPEKSPIEDKAIWNVLAKIDGQRASRIAEYSTRGRAGSKASSGAPIGLFLSDEDDHSEVKFFLADALAKERDACLEIVAPHLTEEQKASVSAQFNARSTVAMMLRAEYALAVPSTSSESATTERCGTTATEDPVVPTREE